MTSKEKAKDARLKKTFNITLATQNETRADQHNKCAICDRDFETFTAFQDHDHKCCPRRLKNYCGKCCRGLLCYPCNKYLIGVVERMKMADGSPLDVQRLIDYKRKWQPILIERGAYEVKPEPKKKKSTRLRKKKESVRHSDASVPGLEQVVPRSHAIQRQRRGDKVRSKADSR